VAERAQVRVLKDMLPIAVSLGLIWATTVVLWRLYVITGGSQGLVYSYLFPVALIAGLYNGRIALLCAVMALVCADYFMQEPLYSFANDDPREYGDLFSFALLAVTAIKFIRVLVRPRATLESRALGCSRLGRL
jgi:K+-sensing histidine kinase KdpD